MPAEEPLKYLKEHKVFIFSLALIISSHYYYLYFVSFHEGVTQTPLAMQIIKIFASALFYRSFFDFKKAKPKTDMLCISLYFSIIILLYKSTLFAINDFLFFNFFALSIPYITYRPRLRTELVNIFFPALVSILCIQITIDYILVKYTHSIWENKAFIGGFGNPSTFGIICNLAVAYIITRRHKCYHFIPLLIITYGACQTKSLATIAVLLTLYLLNIAHQKDRYNILLATFMATCAAVIIFTNIEGHLAYKLQSLARYLDIPQHQLNSQNELRTSAPISTSIGNRSLLYHHIMDELMANPIKILLLGSMTSFYASADSQLITFANSFGIILSCTILYNLIFPFFSGIVYNSKYFSQSCGLIFIIYCASNRILEYYPISFILIILLGQLNANRQHQVKVLSLSAK